MDSNIVTARIDGGGVTLIIAGLPDRIPAIVYWGSVLPDHIDIGGLYQAVALPVAHAGLDESFSPSLFPETGRGDFGTAALEAFRTDIGDTGSNGWATCFALQNIDLTASHMILYVEDRVSALGLSIHLALDEQTGVLEAKACLVNKGQQNLVVNFLSCPALPISSADSRILSWHGRWCAEFTREEAPWHKGARIWESKNGRTSHEAFPGMISAPADTCEEAGNATAFHLAHSGSWRLVAEDIAPGARRVLAGALYLPGEMILVPGAALETPSIYAATCRNGFNGVSGRFHKWLRGKIVPAMSKGQPRPVHYNSWEALYFNQNMPDLLKLVRKAAEAGAERFVVDDGWFKGRIDDSAGLGDWVIDSRKFPDGFDLLSTAIQQAGMSFGLWIEPEMVNPDSDLYRAHPDWVLGFDSYPLVTGRRQLVLDVARPAVRDYLFDRIDTLLSTHGVTYLKWDMNRPLVLPARNGRPVAQEQVTALYDLMMRIRSKHPNVDIESCASGGGRIDFAIARYCHRFWLSDNNDTHDRWAMARQASYFFPPEVMGFHVGPSPCHTSGRMLDMKYRAYSAAICGHMGIELDLSCLSDEEMETLRDATNFYKSWRDVLHQGSHHRLDLPPDYLGHLTLSSDGTRFLAAITQRATLTKSAPPLITLSGLSDDKIYRVIMASGYQQPLPRARHYESPLTTESGYRATGKMLRDTGFRLPPAWPDQLFILEGYLAD